MFRLSPGHDEIHNIHWTDDDKKKDCLKVFTYIEQHTHVVCWASDRSSWVRCDVYVVRAMHASSLLPTRLAWSKICTLSSSRSAVLHGNDCVNISINIIHVIWTESVLVMVAAQVEYCIRAMCDSVTTKPPLWTKLYGWCWSWSVTFPVFVGLQLSVASSLFILCMNNVCSSDVSLRWRITAARCVSIWCLLVSQWIFKLYWIRYCYQYCTLVVVCWDWSALVSVYIAQTLNVHRACRFAGVLHCNVTLPYHFLWRSNMHWFNDGRKYGIVGMVCLDSNTLDKLHIDKEILHGWCVWYGLFPTLLLLSGRYNLNMSPAMLRKVVIVSRKRRFIVAYSIIPADHCL